jgi:beta-mannanase
MDGWWWPWGEGRINEGGPIVNGNESGDFVAMWRHIHDIFVDEQVDNVTWVWCIGQLSTSSQYPSLSQIYPGDDVVDWIGMDPYNKYRTWLSFSQMITGDRITWLKNTYQELASVAPEKPMMLGEFGSVEKSDDPLAKAEWFTDALSSALPERFPRIQAVIYFNWALNHPTVAIESSSEAQNAFAQGIASAYYASNTFSQLCTSPIPPLVSLPPPSEQGCSETGAN